MERIKYGYFSDPSFQQTMPRVTRELKKQDSSLRRARIDLANALFKTYTSYEIFSIGDAYLEADSLITSAGDDPEAALRTLNSALSEIKRGIDRESKYATAEAQAAGEGASDVSAPDVAAEVDEEMEMLKVPNEQIYAAYKSIFGVMP